MIPSAPVATHYKAAHEPTITAEVVNGMNYGQTLYIRQVTRSCPHKFILCINTLVIISSVGIAVSQIWGMAMKALGLMEVVMRTYLIAISGMIIMNELELSAVLKRSPILQKYMWRGLFYSFIGNLGALLNDIGKDSYNRYNGYNNNNYKNNSGYITFRIPTLEHFIESFIQVTSVVLFLMGCIYLIMGLLFVQGKIEQEIEKYRVRLAAAEAQLAGEQDVVRRRFGGRLGEEIGFA